MGWENFLLKVGVISNRALPIYREATERLMDETGAVIYSLAAEGGAEFLIDGARGFNTMLGLMLIMIRSLRVRNVSQTLLLPCPDREKHWARPERDKYEMLLREADGVSCLYPAFTHGCIAANEARIVDEADVILAYVKEGSAFAAEKRARHSGKRMIYLGQDRNE